MKSFVKFLFVLLCSVVSMFGVIVYSDHTQHRAMDLKTQEDPLMKAIIAVESGGGDHWIGDRHLRQKAYGHLQIRQPVCDDVNRKLGTAYKAEDCLGNKELSVKIYKVYIGMYATAARLGHEPTMEDKARIWNGGPNGWKKASTLAYWNKVRKELTI